MYKDLHYCWVILSKLMKEYIHIDHITKLHDQPKSKDKLHIGGLIQV